MMEQSHLVRVQGGACPVVQVVMELVFTRDKLELLQEAAVPHHIQNTEEVKTFL